MGNRIKGNVTPRKYDKELCYLYTYLLININIGTHRKKVNRKVTNNKNVKILPWF
jgi:hypothetical protein